MGGLETSLGPGGCTLCGGIGGPDESVGEDTSLMEKDTLPHKAEFTHNNTL